MTKRSQCSTLTVGPVHCLKENEIEGIRNSLLRWYSTNKRILPWRSIASSEKDTNKRAYAVWVSEIMLQQTQVSTVVSYFNNWMSRWPTVSALADATLEEVNKIWAGLGYYSRAERLYEGAIKISEELKGEFPQNKINLQKVLPGVGRYTASAIASIAMKEPVGVVDGNVLRVLSRFCAIGSDISQAVIEEMWKLADQLVDTNEPGDFNQAIMELGATVCTPKNPSCQTCPLRKRCVALAQTNRELSKLSAATTFIRNKTAQKSSPVDIECVPDCDLCLKRTEWDKSLGVRNFPRKNKKTTVKNKTSAVVILRNNSSIPEHFFCLQRPKTGLLANLWEFLSIPLAGGEKDAVKGKQPSREILRKLLKDEFSITKEVIKNLNVVGNVTHIFSHIHQTYIVYKIDLEGNVDVPTPTNYQGVRWMTEEEFLACATSTAMKKVFKAYKSSFHCGKLSENRNMKRSSVSRQQKDTKQRKLSHFFSPIQKCNKINFS